MIAAGIDTTAFTAHSTQRAATSKANSDGVPMLEIMKAAILVNGGSRMGHLGQMPPPVTLWRSHSYFSYKYNFMSGQDQFI